MSTKVSGGEPAAKPPLILIVDDVPVNLKVLRSILRQKDYRIVAAVNGIQALELMKTIHPELILLDIMMPEMDGFEVCQRLQKMPDKAEIPVIFLTAKTESAAIIQGFEAGAVDYLTKPFKAAELLARVNTHLALKQSRNKLQDLNAQLRDALEDITRLNNKLAAEMRDARDVQMAFLPKEIPFFPGWEMNGLSLPAREVGGDFFDLFRIDEFHTLIAVGDVAGKGMPAALLMAECRSIIRSQVLSRDHLNPRQIIDLVNRMIYADSEDCMFVTCCLGILHNHSGRFNYCNAAHNPPLVYHQQSGKLVELSPTGTVLGFSEEMAYESGEIKLLPGDLLLLYSDGITEAHNLNYEHYEEQRLEEVFVQSASAAAPQILDRILKSVEKFVGRAEQADDMTLVVVKRKNE